MSDVVLFAALGLGSGALIAGLAMALTLTYRGSGVVNVATGAVAMVAGYAFWSLRSGTYGMVFSTASALVLTFVVSVVLGVVMEFLAFRPLRSASPLAKMVASLGLWLIAQASILLAFGGLPRLTPSTLPDQVVHVFGVGVPVNHLALAGIAIGIAVLLTLVYRWTRFGLATRAAAESEASAMLAGLSPAGLSAANTAMASVVAGTLGVLALPVLQLDTVTLPFLVVPALAAALIARFTSFLVACGAGLVIGIVEHEIYYLSTKSWFPNDHGAPILGVEQLLEFAVIVVALFWWGAKLPRRGEIVERGLPLVPRPTRIASTGTLTVVGIGLALIVLPYDFRQALINSVIGAVLALSLIVVTGFVGQISVVQLALSGSAGFIMSTLATRAGITFPLAPLIGALAATALGIAIGISALRLRGVQLAVVTLAAAVAIEHFWFANPTWGSGQAGAPVPQPGLFGLDFGNDASFRGLDGKIPSPVLGFFIVVVAVLLGALVANLRRTALGQAMLAVRSNERAAAAAGVNVRNVKVAAFGLGSFIAGIAGALYAYNFGSVSADRFSAFTAFGVIAYVFVGGITRVSGAAIAGLISTEGLLPHAMESWFGLSGTWSLLFGGIFVIAVLIFCPQGVMGRARVGRARRIWLAAGRAGAERAIGSRA